MWIAGLPACLALALWCYAVRKGRAGLATLASWAVWLLAGGALYHGISVGGIGPLLLLGLVAAAAVWALGRASADRDLRQAGFGWLWPLSLILLLRTFLYEPYQIPSSSMEPGLERGHFILVNRFALGVRPVEFSRGPWFAAAPRRGDVIVFRSPEDRRLTLIKRVVGIPGDRVEYARGVLRINGLRVPCPWDEATEGPGGECLERLPGEEGAHLVRYGTRQLLRRPGDGSWTVPLGRYLVLGDNRDNSRDGRFWGELLRDELIIGRADSVWMHWRGFGKLPRFPLRAVE